MSKRYRVRKANAAKREKHYEVLQQFYDNVIEALTTEQKRLAAMSETQPVQPKQP